MIESKETIIQFNFIFDPAETGWTRFYQLEADLAEFLKLKGLEAISVGEKRKGQPIFYRITKSKEIEAEIAEPIKGPAPKAFDKLKRSKAKRPPKLKFEQPKSEPMATGGVLDKVLGMGLEARSTHRPDASNKGLVSRLGRH